MNQWMLSNRFDKFALPLANRHYPRQTPESDQFVTPGRCLVLLTEDAGALWVTSWPLYTRHRWKGAWVNTVFRRESGPLASELIRSAVSVTRWRWSDTPALGMVTFIDRSKVRHKRDYGRCYRRAGFVEDGETGSGKLALRLPPEAMPEPEPPRQWMESLFPQEETVEELSA